MDQAAASLPPDLVERLRAAGYRITPPRLAVLEIILREGQHQNPGEILRQAQAIHPNISRATVYRTLELLTELGIVRPIYVGENGPTYIRAEGGHHHLVCAQCGKIVDFDQCGADSLARELEARYGLPHPQPFAGILRSLRRVLYWRLTEYELNVRAQALMPRMAWAATAKPVRVRHCRATVTRS